MIKLPISIVVGHSERWRGSSGGSGAGGAVARGCAGADGGRLYRGDAGGIADAFGVFEGCCLSISESAAKS